MNEKTWLNKTGKRVQTDEPCREPQFCCRFCLALPLSQKMGDQSFLQSAFFREKGVNIQYLRRSRAFPDYQFQKHLPFLFEQVELCLREGLYLSGNLFGIHPNNTPWRRRGGDKCVTSHSENVGQTLDLLFCCGYIPQATSTIYKVD